MNALSSFPRFRSIQVVLLAVAATASLSGCRVDEHKDGKTEDVKIATPFGGMQVKTDDAAVTADVGLPVYPGATIVKKDNGKDDNAADVNMSFGAFKMRIKAVSYHSEDTPEKVSAFYRPALAKYGDIIQCDHNKPVGTPTQTKQGLTCDNNKSNHINVSGSGSGDIELKAGSQQHQHIVAIDKDGGGVKIGLVALDLPGKIDFSGDSDNDKQ